MGCWFDFDNDGGLRFVGMDYANPFATPWTLCNRTLINSHDFSLPVSQSLYGHSTGLPSHKGVMEQAMQRLRGIPNAPDDRQPHY